MPSGKQILLSVLAELSQQSIDEIPTAKSDDRLQAALLFHRSTADETWGKVANTSWLSEIGADGRTLRKGVGLADEGVFLTDIVQALIGNSELSSGLKERFPNLSHEGYTNALESIWELLSALEFWEQLSVVENGGHLDLEERDRMLENMLEKLKLYRADPEAYLRGDYESIEPEGD